MENKNTPVKGSSFDFVIEFSEDNPPTLYIEQDLLDTVNGMIKHYGTIRLQANFFSPDVHLYSASVTSPEPFSGTEDANPSVDMGSS